MKNENKMIIIKCLHACLVIIIITVSTMEIFHKTVVEKWLILLPKLWEK